MRGGGGGGQFGTLSILPCSSLLSHGADSRGFFFALVTQILAKATQVARIAKTQQSLEPVVRKVFSVGNQTIVLAYLTFG